MMQLIVSTFHCRKQLHDTEFASACSFHTLSSDCRIQDTLSGELSPGKTVTTLLAKTFFHSLFSLGWVELVSSSPTEQSALCCCSFTKGDCCLFEAVWVTHQFMSIQVCPSWQCYQGDWGQNQMGSLTHEPRGRKHFGMWVVCFEPWKRAPCNFDCGWWDYHPRQPSVKDKTPEAGRLRRLHKFVFNNLAQPEMLLADLLNVQKASSCLWSLSLRLQTLHEAQAGWRRREAGRGDGGRHPHHDLRVCGHVLQHAGAPLLFLWPPGYDRHAQCNAQCCFFIRDTP